ncbi:MAG: 3-hydroxyacyl-ACP dehydratase FabZ family protein [Candidatus Auribacterota bacterium]|jgi:3-hydroxyacyl-[acyl-carrier-protein] dehydratase|nr:3-hydroxyacyl-ACP dehydratase FabZ family protein [Candidatus Auribacterota bacterium]
MRWIMIDRFLDLKKGEYAKAIKNVTMGEDHIHDQYPSYPIMPNTLIIEAMAQTGGILAGKSLDFKRQVFLAKLEKVTFYAMVCPGDQLILDAWIDDLREEGGRFTARAMVGDTLVADASIMFVCLKNPNGSSTHRKNGDEFIFGRELLSVLNLDLNS